MKAVILGLVLICMTGCTWRQAAITSFGVAAAVAVGAIGGDMDPGAFDTALTEQVAEGVADTTLEVVAPEENN